MRNYSTDQKLSNVPIFGSLNDLLELFRTLIDNVNSDLRIQVGSYIGDGAADHDVITIFTPVFLVIISEADIVIPVMWNPISGFTKSFDGNNIANAVTGWTPKRDGFRLGNNVQVNDSGINYNYFTVGV